MEMIEKGAYSHALIRLEKVITDKENDNKIPENYYMQDQNKEMHVIDQELFFVIDEKNNSIELTEKGLELEHGFIKDSV